MIRTDEVSLRQRAQGVAGGVLVLLGLLWGVANLTQGAWWLAAVYLGGALVPVAILVYVRRTGRVELGSHLVLAAWNLAMIVATAATGGLTPANVPPFFLMLVVPFFLLGWRGLAWALGSLGVALGFQVAQWVGVGFGTVVHPQSQWLDAFLTWFTSAGILLFFLASYEWERAATEVRRAATAHALRVSVAQHRLLVEHVHEGVVVDQGGLVVFANGRLGLILGRSVDDLVGVPLIDLVHPGDREVAGERAGRVQRGEVVDVVQLRFLAGDGTPRWVEIASLWVDAWGESASVLHFLKDVTARRTMEAALREREQILRQAQKMDSVGRLAGGVAHDFNNHLTSILGFAQLVLVELPEGDELREDVAEIATAARRASSLTRQLLAFSRRQLLKPETLDLNTVVTDMARMLVRLIGEDVRLVLELSPETLVVHADAGQLEQVLMNLVVNARDAMPGGGRVVVRTGVVDIPPLVVRLRRLDVAPGSYVSLEVVDEGTGMPEEVRSKVFEPFFTTKPKGRGTGLGLSVVYGIVRQHDGVIDVISQPGEGSTFRVALPATDAALPTLDDLTEDTTGPVGGGERVLMVEDDAEVRRLARKLLLRGGYRVAVADSAEAALQLLDADADGFALVFSDVVLPGLSGVQLAERVWQQDPSASVLLCSGYAEPRSQWDAIRERGIPFLPKPYSLPELLRAVHSAMG